MCVFKGQRLPTTTATNIKNWDQNLLKHIVCLAISQRYKKLKITSTSVQKKNNKMYNYKMCTHTHTGVHNVIKHRFKSTLTITIWNVKIKYKKKFWNLPDLSIFFFLIFWFSPVWSRIISHTCNFILLTCAHTHTHS